MIRCTKCGFSNNDFLEKCIKCRTNLKSEEVMTQVRPTYDKRTIQVRGDEQAPWDQSRLGRPIRNFLDIEPEETPGSVKLEEFDSEQTTGANLGADTRKPEKWDNTPKETEYTLSNYGVPEVNEIPLTANTEKIENREVSSGPPTVRRFFPKQNHPNYLIAISPDDEKELRKIELIGNEVLLDRTTLDAANTSISRSGHANIYFKDGSWFLENKTALKTTFVQVNQPVKLSDGDVILLGDSLFKFKQS